MSCHHICSPNQTDYISNVRNTKFKIPDGEIDVIAMDVDVQSNAACDVFKSASKNAFFRQLDATKTLIGFLNFFGTSGVYQTNPENPDDKSTHIASYYNLVNEGGFSSPVVPCGTSYSDDQFFDEFGYPVIPSMKCGCSSCQENCQPIDWNKIIVGTGILHGFDTNTLYLGGFLILIVVFAALWKCYRNRVKRDRNMSVDSYDRIKAIIEDND